VEISNMTVFKDLSFENLERLQPGKWLNDSLVFSGIK
jgi:hypothetical protein